MKNEIVFATNNEHKLKEIREILENEIDVLSLTDIGSLDEIPEDNDTLEENALQKARYVNNKFGFNCLADDTGLEVAALNGAPGVYSARYAGESRSSEENIKKLLSELYGIEDRKARFRTVIALLCDGKEYIFEGIINGKITDKKVGTNGFGYDPVFIPEGYTKTFAELSSEEKNIISHRALAVKKLVDFLKIIEK